METITVTVKTADGTFKKTVDNAPIDMRLGDFKDEARKLVGIPERTTCHLQLERTGKAMLDNDTFQSAGIKNEDVFVLTTENEGG